MIFKLYITRLKCLFRNKENMFWCYLFPILLATCFFLTFNNTSSFGSFKTIVIAYDNQGAEADPLKEALDKAEMSEGKPIFAVTYCNQEKASELLAEGEIEAYIVGSSDPELFVKENGMNETIIKSFLDSYLQIAFTVDTVIQSNPEAISEGLLTDVMQYNNYVYERKNEKKPDAILIYFYALIAYTCIFAANWGLDEAINIQADLSNRGARINVSPIRKMKLFLCNMLAALTAHCGSLILLFLYINFVIKVNFGSNMIYLLITCLTGSLAGLVLGATIGVWVKKKPEVKEAILTVVVLGGGFLSGMMVGDMKYLVAENFPLLSYINPVNLVADALYSLYYYDTYDRFYLNITILCVITLVLGVLSYIGIRRKNYASI